MKIAICVLSAILLTCGCANRHDVTGNWQSPPHQTEWGEVIYTLLMRPDGTCAFSMSPTDAPDAEPIVSEGRWRSTGHAAAIITLDNAKPDSHINISLVNQTTIVIDAKGDAIKLIKIE